MWERKYKRSHDQARESDLEQFNFAYRFFLSPPNLTVTPLSLPRLQTLQLLPVLSKPWTWKRLLFHKPRLRRRQHYLRTLNPIPLSECLRSCIYSTPWKVYSCSRTTMSLRLLLRLVLGNVRKPHVQHRTYTLDWLSIATSKKTWLSQQMEAEMNPVFNYVNWSSFEMLISGTSFFHLELLWWTITSLLLATSLPRHWNWGEVSRRYNARLVGKIESTTMDKE